GSGMKETAAAKFERQHMDSPDLGTDDDDKAMADIGSEFAIGSAAETETEEVVVEVAAANEELPVMPWATSVASGYTLLRDPRHNKGLAFTERERDAHYLRGLLPPAVVSQELQIKKFMNNLRQYQLPIQCYMAMMNLQETDERLFYKLLIENVVELLPYVYTPTVGEACQKYGSIFGRPQGLYVSLKDKGRVLEVLRNWPHRNVQVICVTDGERILGLGDLGCQGMGIPVGKLALYTALGGVDPSACLPITIDVGTNNEKLLNDEFYIGLRQKRARGEEYDELMEEFMAAVKTFYGEKVLIQFEDFANHNAFDLLEKYSKTHLVFNDDIQGTASVVLAGLLAALKMVGGTLAEQTYLFLGAGEAGTGIAELIALEMSKQTKAPIEECRKKVWLVDSKGLIVDSRKSSLAPFKKPWAHEHEPLTTLYDAVQSIKPTVLIGTSGVGRTFTKEIVEAMASINERPIIFSLSNPTSHSECTAEQAYTWTQGRAVFASGSPFAPVEYDGKTFVPGQSNNAYIFPGLGLGLVISGAVRVHEDMLLAASAALADQATEENFVTGSIFPPFTNIRKISAYIAAAVAAKAYELGLATRLPPPKDLVAYAESCMYSPVYRNYQ
uniref:Malic enzyme n=1 Tax=Sorghum bicolor TaxID=4558 RepID=UPI00100527D2|nr:Chain A, Malic enzyme [Sorghum bicolor]6C7N_B Chain B, Malic enzyme [Sorghum bicolor]6C7N_C Chain C, Malic enzyme [Sorghum bicolor]6C7N_D Chain D, Malic enzyme [Sorghum bicolor]